jgi:nitrite reductase/ring-hydroxylating ferredoxin subunit
MLSREENERMCRVGPGTPMGEVLRRYWIPVLPSADLPTPDSDPVRVRRLGQNFVAFRDTKGRVGVLDEQCTHRGASLTFGRVEDCGIRCLYHGWKFAVDGTIMDTPNMADNGRFREKLKAPAYPVHEAGDIVFAYFGPPEKAPPPPRFKWMEGPSSQRFVFEMIQEHCNFVQALEGGLDSSHVGILHGDEMRLASKGLYDPDGIGKDRYPTTDNAPQLRVENTTFGFHYAAMRQASDNESSYVRITPYIMPFMTFPAGGTGVMRIPMDDETTAVITVNWDHDQPANPESVMRRQGMDNPAVYGPDKVLRILPQDRAAMRRGESYSGIVGFNPQDGAMTMNMGGPIFDRSKEHVVPADHAILRMRRLLLKAADVVAAGGDPVGTTPDVDTSQVFGASGVIKAGDRWQDLVPGHVAV